MRTDRGVDGWCEDERATAWNRELYDWWSYYNREFLDEALRRPEIRLTDGEARLGTWDAAARVISISIEHLARDPWTSVMDTLRHEMAHQYVDEIDGGAARPHGDEFARACERLRVSPAPHVGLAGEDGRGARGAARDRVRDVIAKLLSLGSSPNRHEAESALRKARALLLEHEIALAEIRADRDFGVRVLGPIKARHSAWEYSLSALLNEFFFVETLWARGYDTARSRRGTVLHVYGTPANLDMAEYVYGFLTGVLERLWRDYRAEQRLAGDRERMRFYGGVLSGFVDKLRAQERSLAQESGLVYRGDERLREYFRHHNPRVRTSWTQGVRATAAYEHGRQQGREVTLHRPLREVRTDHGGQLGA